ncbi:MAG: glutathione transport system ATP-binding protein [Actinomycetota bacterium]|jgi:peptide/nickel transport system ATP-binding protein
MTFSVSDDPVLRVNDLVVDFPSEAGTVNAVRNVSYEVARGEVFGVVGESGSGKSVSALAVLGLLPNSARVSGSVTFRGRELLGLGDAEMSAIRGRNISIVFQDPLSALTPVYTVGQQIVEAVRVHNDVSRDDAEKRAIELLDLVGIPHPAERVRNFPHEFSGGMRQRVMIAMAIANNPDVIIADEPTTALDVTIQAQVLEVLERAQEATGAAIVMITHDLGVVAGFADRVMVMYAGKPVETGTVDDIFYRPRMPYTLGLLGSLPRADASGRDPLTPVEGSPPSLVALPAGCPFAPRCPLKIEVCEQAEPPLYITDDPNHRSACHRWEVLAETNPAPSEVFAAPPPPPRPDEATRDHRPVVLEVDGLVREYPLTRGTIFRRQVGAVAAVDGISFDIREGETLGLVGESGCGKTTTINEILTLAKPTRGRISVLGHETSSLTNAERHELRRDVSVVFQDPMASLDPKLPISDILSEGLSTFGVPKAERGPRVRELLHLVGLSPSHASRYPHEFSGGQRQRVGIARALALQPKLVILDEPVSALDVSIRAGIINLLEQLRSTLRLSYLFVAHDLSVVRHSADRVAVMYLGRIVEIGAVAPVFAHPAHPYTQALLSAVPLPDPRRERERERIILQGDLPSTKEERVGCRFRGRCPTFAALDDTLRRQCVEIDPPLMPHGDDQRAACHYPTLTSVF